MWKKFIKEIDTNNDEKISYDEFLAGMMKIAKKE